MGIVTINGNLIFPPSELLVVRDITLYCNIFKKYNVLLYVDNQHKDVYYNYLKDHGCFDYIDEIVDDLEPGSRIISDTAPYNIKVRKIWAGNLNRIISSL